MANREEEKIQQKVMAIYRHLHAHPERSWQEVETTRYIQDILKENGLRVRTFSDCTGVVGEWGEGQPIVALRADMDALMQEVNGSFCANHSCGHDAHMAIVLGVMFLLKSRGVPKIGTIRFIFQPAEEVGGGALKMIDKGVVDDVDFLFGVHLRPEQELALGQASPAIYHGAARHVHGKIQGEDAHGARPHLGASAVEAAAMFVQMLNAIHLAPDVPYSAKMTQLNTGAGSANIIAGRADFTLDLRAANNKAMAELAKAVGNAADAVQKWRNVEVELQTVADIAAAEVNEQAEDIMRRAIRSIAGEKAVVEPLQTAGGDDFHFYTLKRPHLKATMLGLGAGLRPGLHHPKMTFELDALMSGATILAEAVRLACLEKGD